MFVTYLEINYFYYIRVKMNDYISTRLFIEIYGIKIIISFLVVGVSPIKIVGVFEEENLIFGREIEI